MATEVQNYSEQSVTSLVSGIVSDFQDLVKQQMRLTRQEIEADLRKTKEGVSSLAIGGGLALLGAFAGCLAVAHLLHWLAAPAGSDPSSLPLWASFAITALLFLSGAGIAFVAGKKKLDALRNPLPDTSLAMKENLEWKTKPSPS